MLLLSKSTHGIARRQEDWQLIETIENICKMLWASLANSKMVYLTRFIPNPYHNPWDPVNIWIQETSENHAFTIRLGLAMCYEYKTRFNQINIHEADILELRRIGYYKPRNCRTHSRPVGFFRKELSPFPFVFRSKYLVRSGKSIDIVQSHRKYHKIKNKRKYSPRHPAYAPPFVITE